MPKKSRTTEAFWSLFGTSDRIFERSNVVQPIMRLVFEGCAHPAAELNQGYMRS